MDEIEVRCLPGGKIKGKAAPNGTWHHALPTRSVVALCGASEGHGYRTRKKWAQATSDVDCPECLACIARFDGLAAP